MEDAGDELEAEMGMEPKMMMAKTKAMEELEDLVLYTEEAIATYKKNPRIIKQRRRR